MIPSLAEQRSIIESILAASGRLSIHHQQGMAEILKSFLRLGFTAARYYEVAYSVPAEDQVFVLSISVGTTQNTQQIGYKIHRRDTSFASMAQPRPIVASPDSLPNEEAVIRWIDDLGLVDCRWLDLPLVTDGHILGLIACTFPATALEIAESDLTTLELLGARIASHLTLAAPLAIEKARSRIADLPTEDDLGSLLDKASEEIRAAVGGSILAVFEHQWETDTLRKLRSEERRV